MTPNSPRQSRVRPLVPLVTALLVFALTGAPIWAAEDGTNVDDNSAAGSTAAATFEGELTVIESPVVEEGGVDRYGHKHTEVSAEQVDDLGAQDLSAALRRVPGVVVSRYNAIGAFGGGDGGAVFIRGHGSGRPGAEVVTMVDGVPRFVGIWSHPLLDTLSLDPAQRIEVHRAPEPVLLGNMAFGAVNLISKRHDQPGSAGRLVLSAGEYRTAVGRAEWGGRWGGVDAFLTSSHRSSDGHRPDSGGEVKALSGRLGFELGTGWSLGVQVNHTEGWADDPGPEGARAAEVTERYRTDADLFIATIGHRHGDWSGELKLYHDDGLADWLQWDEGSRQTFTTITETSNWGLRLRERYQPWSGGELLLGLDHEVYGGRTVEHWAADDRAETDLHFRNTAPLLMLSHVFGDRVKVTPSAGVRFNSSRHFGDDWGLQAGLRVALGDVVLYANAARGFNLPGVYSAALYSRWGRGDSWRQLDAEIIEHLEAGAVWQAATSVQLELSLFRDAVSNAIRWVPPPPPPPAFANIGDYTTRGAELGLHLQHGRLFGAFIGATWSDPEPADLPNMPQLSACLGLSWRPLERLRLHLDAEWVDRRLVLNPRFSTAQAAVEAYLLANARAVVSLPTGLLSEPVQLFVAGENLGNERYEHRLGYPLPGRTWTVGAELRF